jgi:hypothetical protein
MRPRLHAVLAAVALAAVVVAPAADARKKPRKVNAIFQGTVHTVSASSGRLVMNVTGANVYGSKRVNKRARFNLRKATLELGDMNQDGAVNLGDVAAGHIVAVTAKVRKKRKLPRTIKGQHFTDLSALVVIPTGPPAGPLVPTAP